MINLFKSLKLRLLLALFVILFTLFYSFGYVVVHTLEKSYQQSLDTAIFTVLKDIKHEYMKNPDHIGTMLNAVKDEFDMPLLFAQIVTFDLRLNSTAIDLRSLDLKDEKLEVTESLLHKVADRSDKITFSNMSLSKLTQRQIRIGTLFLADKGEQLVFLQCALPYDKHTPQIKKLMVTLWIGLSLLLSVILILAYYLISKSLSSVQTVTNAAKKIRAQDAQSTIPKSYVAYEVDDLIATFNALLSELQHAYAQIKQFGQNASHELKTPLTIIKGEVEVGLRKARSSEEYQSILHDVEKEISHLQEIIEKILFLSSNTTVDLKKHFTEVYIDEILLDAIQEKSLLAQGHSVTLKLDFLEAVSRQGNATLLKIAFVNLLDNAIKYSPAHSTVHITLKDQSLSIYDQGIGIDAQALEHIFEQFYRSEKGKQTSKGYGLGLALVKTIIELHNFTITISSEEGIGTQTCVSF